jgi:hypothetical protein
MTDKNEGFELCRFLYTFGVIIQPLLVGLRLELNSGSLARHRLLEFKLVSFCSCGIVSMLCMSIHGVCMFTEAFF